MPDLVTAAALSRLPAAGEAAERLAQAESLLSGTGWLPLLERLIALDTSFPPGSGYGAFADALEQAFSQLGFSHRRVPVPEALWRGEDSQAEGERVNLIAERRTGRPVCGIYVHTDTVPAGEGWTRAPLALTREGDRLYGRGTADMKGTIAATYAALRAAEAAGLPLRFDPMLLFCTDEEGGLYPGIRYLAEQGMLEGHMLCLNGGATPRIYAGSFGSIDLAIRIIGRAAHSGDPGRGAAAGVNAVEEAFPVLQELLALKARVQQRASALPAPPHFQGAPLTARLTIAAIQGGSKGSALPGLCRILVNRRYMPEESFDEAWEELTRAITTGAARSRALAVESSLVGHLTPVSGADEGPNWARWQRALSHGFGFPAGSFLRHGSSTSSDMGFVQQAGLREILLGGLIRADSRAHGPDEFTTIGDVEALARSILHYLADLPTDGDVA
jgi:succinyl-diaminopimelate desuccinylase